MTANLQPLIDQIRRYTSGDGTHLTPLKSMSFFTRSKPSTCDANIYKPSLIVTLQGEKQLHIFGETCVFKPGDCLITAVDMPMLSNMVKATKEEPYVCVIFELDTDAAADLITEMDIPTASPPDKTSPAVSITSVSDDILDIIKRSLSLLDNPRDIPVLYPMLERELIYRLLTSEQGSRLKHSCVLDSSSHKISRAIKYLNQNYRETIRVEELAELVNMSVSSMHSHFKAVTTLTPLQYQKQLRLQEARRLIVRTSDVSSSAYQVGYESASQFSRDYSRLFGLPPSQDKMRQQQEYQ
ncbi:AraC family transcriptional regulator N-terminal domain-containing protein [Rhodanobacter aciditrophus]|uniref:AraC family transcriptional regulator N-terminal domain-containing protein n=1 Tax=Rhodanobacter aciditrophus TaxID=1623218 RepID=A0ABW4AVW2_9GAMM